MAFLFYFLVTIIFSKIGVFLGRCRCWGMNVRPFFIAIKLYGILPGCEYMFVLVASCK